MHKITRVRLWMIVGLTSFLVAAAYEVRAAGIPFAGVPSYVVALFTLILGASAATGMVNVLTASRWMRRLITTSAHVEGYWYLRTDMGTGESPLGRDGILFIYHEPRLGETRVVTTRLDDEGNEFPTVSEIAYVRGDGIDISYLNHFKLTFSRQEPKFGLSSGRFVMSDDLKPCPNWFEASVIVAGEDIVRRQYAQRIDDQTVRELQRRFGSRWKTRALQQGPDAMFPGESPP
jgi:hypothetical protein